MFMMPGIPAVYYGSEFGVLGDKNQGGDDQLRPEFDLEKMKSEGIRDLTAHIKALARDTEESPGGFPGRLQAGAAHQQAVRVLAQRRG